jgi:anti-sigma B factor antagonist
LLPEQEGTLPLMTAGLSTREYTGHTVITLCGELDATDAAGLTAEFTVAAARNPQIIADLGALDYIDCCALGVLSQMRAQARAAGGDLLLAAPHGLVRRILTLTGLDSVFSVHNSPDEAARTAGTRVRDLADQPRRRGQYSRAADI